MWVPWLEVGLYGTCHWPLWEGRGRVALVQVKGQLHSICDDKEIRLRQSRVYDFTSSLFKGLNNSVEFDYSSTSATFRSKPAVSTICTRQESNRLQSMRLPKKCSNAKLCPCVWTREVSWQS